MQVSDAQNLALQVLLKKMSKAEVNVLPYQTKLPQDFVQPRPRADYKDESVQAVLQPEPITPPEDKDRPAFDLTPDSSENSSSKAFRYSSRTNKFWLSVDHFDFMQLKKGHFF